MEYWSVGLPPITPVLQHSITPFFVSPSVKENPHHCYRDRRHALRRLGSTAVVAGLAVMRGARSRLVAKVDANHQAQDLFGLGWL